MSHTHTHTHTHTHETQAPAYTCILNTDNTKLNSHTTWQRAANQDLKTGRKPRPETDEDGSTLRKPWQLCSFVQRNVLRLIAVGCMVFQMWFSLWREWSNCCGDVFQSCALYWPEEYGYTEEHGPLSVELLSSSDVDPDVTIRIFKLSHHGRVSDCRHCALLLKTLFWSIFWFLLSFSGSDFTDMIWSIFKWRLYCH